MESSEVVRAKAAAVSLARELGLNVAKASVLHDSNRLTMRLLPCDVVARVASAAPHQLAVAEFEVTMANRFAQPSSLVGALATRVERVAHRRDAFVITFWTHYEPTPGPIRPEAYARALCDLHAEMRRGVASVPHVTERVDEALAIVDDVEQSPDLADPDRALLIGTLDSLRPVVERSSNEQLIHGEPHPGNLVATADGIRFIDLQTCCSGPIEFDLAHAPDDVATHYAGADERRLRECRRLMRAMVAAWRADHTDRLPDGQVMLDRLLAEIRADIGAERDG